MAYRSYLKYYAAGQQATVMSDLSTYLQAMGWNREKAVSATRHFLSTVGEDGTHQKFWIDLQASGNYVYIIPYAFINTATDTGYGGNYAASNLSYYRYDCSAAGYLKLYGSKDIVYFEYSSGSVPAPTNATSKIFGVVPNDQGTPAPWAVTANSEAAGAGVTIEVDDTDGFQRNDYYQIFCPSTGMREKIQVTAIVPGVSITATLANAYAAGSIIAYMPNSGFSTSANASRTMLYPVCPIGVSGSGTCTEAYGTWTPLALMASAGLSLSPRNNLYHLIPWIIAAGGGSEKIGSYGTFLVGVIKNDILYNYGLTLADTVGAVDAGNLFFNGTATGGGAATLTDAGQAWGVNTLAGKILTVTGGTGAGQALWIISNTDKEITVGQSWVTQPVSGSTYMITDDLYRSLGSTGLYLLVHETIGQP